MAELKESLPRGDETRSQLLEAALELFAHEGFESVSTRRLAAKSGANIAAIGYHFGGKRELYRAVLKQLVEDTGPNFEPALAGLQAGILEADGNPQLLAAVTSELVENLLRLFLASDFMQWRAPLIMREYANPSADFDILYEGRIEPLHRAVTSLAAAALGRAADDERAAVRAHSIVGQIFVFGIARVVLCKRLDWKSYGPGAVEMIIEEARASVLASLGLPTPPSTSGGSGE